MSSVLPFIYHLLILLPGILIIYLLLKYDKFPEPKNLLIITVLLAFAGTTIFGIVKYKILLVHEWFPTYNEEIELTGFLFYFYNFIDAYILVAFGEELVKYLVIIFFCVKLKELNELLISTGETKINVILKDSNKKYSFELEKTRKFDFNLFSLIKNKTYVKKISF